MLTKNQLKTLRNEICLNSLYLKDYSNSFYIKEKTVCDFFNSFMDHIDDYYNFNNMDYYEVLKKHDNIDEIWKYYCDSCMDGYDPLLQDDYIAYFNNLMQAGCVIYEIDDNKVVCASYYMNKYGNMIINKITKNTIYYDNNGDPYIKKYGNRYLLSNFIKTNIVY